MRFQNFPNAIYSRTGQLRAGLITSGLAASSVGSTLPMIKDRLKSKPKILMVKISSGQCPNLKAALRSIISEATQQSLDDDDEDIVRRDSQVYLNPDYWEHRLKLSRTFDYSTMIFRGLRTGCCRNHSKKS